MTLKYRRLLYSSFIAFFIVITPTVILYATGYRYNFKNHRVEKIGILHIESIPKNADIFINDKPAGKTPSRFIKLLPDKYHLRVSHNGYSTWTKAVELQSSLTTFYRNIVLFKNSLPINIAEGQINITTVSPNQQKMVYSVIKDSIEQIKFVNLKNNAEFIIDDLNIQTYTGLELVEWSPNQDKLLLKKIINNFNQYMIVDTDALTIEEIFNTTRLNFDLLKWDQNSNDRLYGLSKAVLYQVDLINNDVTSLYSANIQDFQVRGNEIFFITKIINENFLNKTTLDDQTIGEIQKIKIPSPSEFKLLPTKQNYLILLDSISRDLFIIDSGAFSAQNITSSIILQDKAKDIVWSTSGNELLFYTDFEIATFDFPSQQKNLITRYGDVITQALWYPGDDYILYQVNSIIKVIEKNGSTNEGRNDITLTELKNIKQLGIDSAGQNLYFKGAVGSQQGIYQLQLQ